MDKKRFETEIDTIYKQKIIKYFEKYFLNKNIDDAVFDAIKNGIVKLSGVYVEFCMICDCFDIIVDNEKLPIENKKFINDIILGISKIKSDIENIITQIAEGMTD